MRALEPVVGAVGHVGVELARTPCDLGHEVGVVEQRVQSTGPLRTGMGLRWRVQASPSIRPKTSARADARSSRGCRRAGGGPPARVESGMRRGYRRNAGAAP